MDVCWRCGDTTEQFGDAGQRPTMPFMDTNHICQSNYHILLPAGSCQKSVNLGFAGAMLNNIRDSGTSHPPYSYFAFPNRRSKRIKGLYFLRIMLP